MSKDPTTVVHRWFNEVWNQGREETIDELMSEDSIAHGLGEGKAAHGRDGFKGFLRNMRSAIPDVHICIEDTIASGDKVVVRVVLEGTHLGEGLGLAPTQRKVAVGGIIVGRVSDGQIVEGWNSWDQLGLLQQLGAVPSPQEQDRFLTVAPAAEAASS